MKMSRISNTIRQGNANFCGGYFSYVTQEEQVYGKKKDLDNITCTLIITLLKYSSSIIQRLIMII